MADKITVEVSDLSKVSDGFHTIQELYEHRVILFIALCKAIDIRMIERRILPDEENLRLGLPRLQQRRRAILQRRSCSTPKTAGSERPNWKGSRTSSSSWSST